MPRIIWGIQPSGELHIGNYLGAIKKWLELQSNSKNECFFFIADYHSLTEEYNPKQKSRDILGLATDLLALGLNPKKSVIFQQSQIPHHTELCWIFNTITPMGELSRMTQFKEKGLGQKESANVGLFDYPVLMAADILIYKTEAVPVGEDQIQHLELARNTARRFNSRFGKTFPDPKIILTETPRIMSLTDPTKKMSKSQGEKSYIALLDSPNIIKEKTKSAVSDIGGKGLGGKNLLAIFKAFAERKSETSEYEKFAKDHKAGNLRYAEFKPRLVELIAHCFADFLKKHEKFSKNPGYVKKVLSEGAERASAIAKKTLKEVKEK